MSNATETLENVWYFLINIRGPPWWLSGKESTCNTGDTSSIPGWGRSPRERNGNPLQYSCLGNPMDRGAWQAIVHGITKESDTTWQLNNNNDWRISSDNGYLTREAKQLDPLLRLHHRKSWLKKSPLNHWCCPPTPWLSPVEASYYGCRCQDFWTIP